MKKLLTIIAALILFVATLAPDADAKGKRSSSHRSRSYSSRSYHSGKTVHVRSYTRRNGTVVRSHTRRPPRR